MLGKPTVRSNFVKRVHGIACKYEVWEHLEAAMRDEGMESSQLIVGIDFTKSNLWNGKKTFGNKSLHTIDGNERNPYEWALTAIAATMNELDDDSLIPCFGFGDVTTKQYGVFPFNQDNIPADGLSGVLSRYREIVSLVDPSGPTNFAPLIHQALRTVIESHNKPHRTEMEYHILLILADGQVSDQYLNETSKAISLASNYPLSIIMIGVGDGPWDKMNGFVESLQGRKFDNFHFVDLSIIQNEVLSYASDSQAQYQHFALNALMKIPDQYKEILTQKLMSFVLTKDKVQIDVLLPLPEKVAKWDEDKASQSENSRNQYRHQESFSGSIASFH